jgi:trimeric autotransporter adhesin
MATYVNDLRLKEIATGDEAGTWGTSTNTNLELIAEAFSYGTEAITTNADTHTTTIADGSTDPGRSLYLKYTGTLDSACTITLGPNTVSKMWFIENATTGSQNIIISQGSGANVTIPPGDVKVVFSDGAGSGAAITDAFASLNVVDLKVQDDLTVTDDLIVNGDIDLEGNMDVNGSLETDALSLNGTTVTSTAAEINLLDGSSANTVVNSKAVIYGSSGEVAGTLSTAAQPNITSVGTLTGLTTSGDINFGDNDKAVFGAGSDLQIYHDGTHSYIKDAGTGNLKIQGAAYVILESDEGEIMLRAQKNDSVKINYDNTTKLETTSTGIDVTGTAVTDGLTVAGNVSVDGGTIKLDGNYPTRNDNVALGNTALDSLTTGDNNTSIGSGAGTAVTEGEWLVAVGKDAGAAVTTGLFNNAIGGQALYSETTGANNTAVGQTALFTQNGASNNTAIGYAALYANTTGAQNVAVGSSALDANTTGGNGVAVGHDALSANTTGAENTGVGCFALNVNTTGSYNTALGNFALISNTTADYNTGIGRSALQNNTSGNQNTGLGAFALNSNTQSNRNVALGYNTLSSHNLTSDSNGYNTCVGFQAGSDITTGVQNTFIGALVGDTTTTASNNTAVGYNSFTANTTGYDNVAVGRNALDANTTAHSCVAVGESSLTSNTTGIRNTAVGQNALSLCTTGTENTAIGQNAANDITTGNYNCAMGQNSLAICTTGSSNVSIGVNAGDAVTTASNNTFIGTRSGTKTTDGANNTAIGIDSLEDCTGGGSNVALGSNSIGNVTTGSNNIGIGFNAGKAGTPGGTVTTQNNRICLGNSSITNFDCQVALTVASDERDKTDFNDLDIGLDFVKQLKPYTYKWDKRSKYVDWDENPDTDLNTITHDGTHKEDWLDIGFKAQEVETLEQAAGYNLADKTNLAVSLTHDETLYGIKYEKFVPILTKAIQELSTQVDELKAEIQTLKGE